MAQNVLVAFFEVESEAFQAITELMQNPEGEKSLLSQAVLVKKENGTIKTLDGFNTGVNTTNDTLVGGLVGSLFGILGGPIGVLLGGSYGALVGSVLDADDALDNASIIENIANKMEDNDIAIIGLSEEEDESVLDKKLEKFKVMIIRFDAAAVEKEVAKAEEMASEMARQARKELRKQKKEEFKAKLKK